MHQHVYYNVYDVLWDNALLDDWHIEDNKTTLPDSDHDSVPTSNGHATNNAERLQEKCNIKRMSAVALELLQINLNDNQVKTKGICRNNK